jgi:pyruvate/2-oxoglutarate dehydrogenase complex dihydrolipoamide acyltransferase (E2) component
MSKTAVITTPALWDVRRFGKGVVVEWLKREGMTVKKGDIICIIMAAKVRIEVPSPVEGKILKILAGKGAHVSPGDPLLEIEVAG